MGDEGIASEKKPAAGRASRLPWIALFGVLTLGILAGGYFYYRTEVDDARAEKLAQIKAVADLKADQIRKWRQERLDDAGRVANDPLFSQAVADWLRSPNLSRVRRDLLRRLQLEQSASEYTEAILLDLDAHPLLSAGTDHDPADISLKNALGEALARNAAVLSEPYRCSCGRVHVDAVAPILNPDRRPIAIFVLRGDAQTYLYPLIRFWPTPSPSAETLLVVRDADHVLYLNDPRFQPGAGLSLRLPLSRADSPAVRAALGVTGEFQGRDYRGVEVLADLRPIPDSPWFLVAKIDQIEILSDARYRVLTISLSVVLLILVAWGATALAYRGRHETERRKAEEALRSSEAFLNAVIEQSPHALWISDDQGTLIRLNQACRDLLHIRSDEVVGKYNVLRDSIVREQGVMPLVERAFATGETVRFNLEYDSSRLEGLPLDQHAHVILDVTISAVRDARGRLTNAIIQHIDVTEQKRAEEDVRRAEANFRRTLDDSPLGVRIVTAAGETLYANRALLGLYGFDTLEEFAATPLHKRYTTESYAEFRKRKEGREKSLPESPEYEVSIVRKNGEIRRLRVFRKEVLWSGAPQFLVIYVDITERRRAEAAIQASLREKEVLLREIHHRVKNNMQIISSLLNLQARHYQDPAVAAVFRESHNRIRSMALIHEKLYRAGDLSRLDFSEYIQSMTAHLSLAYGIDPGRIRFEVESEGVFLDINTAIPCGLILNELVSNALAHAFPDGRSGTVRIECRKDEGRSVLLVVADDGIGLPEDFDIRRSASFGLEVVALLVDQLGGTLEWNREGGTKFQIRFGTVSDQPPS
jgi:PAS domain S-box-containing protein